LQTYLIISIQNRKGIEKYGKTNRGRGLVIILALTLPMLIVSLQSATAQPSVWLVYAGDQDENIEIAARTFEQDIMALGCRIGEINLEEMGTLPLNVDAIVLIGHGTAEGLAINGDVLLWSELVGMLEERKPKTAVLLACNSPSNPEARYFGFVDQIDAEAGALLAAWHIKRSLGSHLEAAIPSERIFEAQDAMRNPLGSYVYFVHGFHGNDDQFENLINTLYGWGTFDEYDGYGYFDYFEDYSSHNVAHGASIEEFAENFRNKLIYEHPAGTQIDIVAHSMGGLIVRQMLMEDRQTLESYGIEVARVITLGTPHDGTSIAAPGLGVIYVRIMDLFYNEEPWICDVFEQMGPDNDFITTLNADPLSYSSGIEWYTFSAISNSAEAIVLLPVHLGANDVPVANGRAHLSFATQRTIENCEHNQLIDDTQQRTYTDISTWIAGGIDSDNDGLLDVEEVHVYGTNPNAWSSDADILSDAQEIAWGYNPLDSNNPISASYLVSSAWQKSGKGYVRANHYAAMDYVKVYVKYKTSYGQWTSYMYIAIDYTPNYSGDYYVIWNYLTGYVQMRVKVQAYDSANHYLGSDYQYVTLPSGGGGGGGGGDPFPE
jgi:triacylglycerol esterase/lipase EstA (alpha/beta hydrolase family)